jgi:hypothetical protein
MDNLIGVWARKMLWFLAGCCVLLAAARNLAVSLGGGWESADAQGYARGCEQRARALAGTGGE